MVPVGKVLPRVAHHCVRRPMGRECGGWSNLVRTDADGLAAVTAVFRSQHEFFLRTVVVALRPAIVTAGLQKYQLLSRQRGFFFGLIELRPIRMQLVTPMLRDE